MVVRTEIDYRRPARLWDTLVVHGELAEFERSRFWCAFTITRPSDGKLMVTCRQMLVVVRLPELKVRRLPDHWRTDFAHLKVLIVSRCAKRRSRSENSMAPWSSSLPK